MAGAAFLAAGAFLAGAAFLAAGAFFVALAICFLAAFLVAATLLVALATCFFATFLALATFLAIAFRLVFACFSARSTRLELAMAVAAWLTFDPTDVAASSMESMAVSTITSARVCLRGTTQSLGPLWRRFGDTGELRQLPRPVPSLIVLRSGPSGGWSTE